MDNASSDQDRMPSVSDLVDDDIDDIRDENSVGDVDSLLEPDIKVQEHITIENDGESFNETTIQKYLKKKKPIIISVIGDTGCGKSSLIQCLYELFQKGPISRYNFRSSHTLIGFDRRSHYARLSSGGEIATTPRTSLGTGAQYYHLSVSDGVKVKNIIIADRAGESYNQFKNKPSLVNDCNELMVCDTAIILVDGDKLSKGNQVAKTLLSVRQMVMAIVDNLNRTINFPINIVISKSDMIENLDESIKLKERICSFTDELKSYSEDKNIEFVLSYISSRPNNSELPFGYGVDKLFKSWCDIADVYDFLLPIKNYTGDQREIDRFF